MNHPSLLFTNEPKRGDVAFSVFEDLCLDLLLPKAALKVMSGICPRGDIPLRAELFSALEDGSFYGRIEKLYNIISSANALGEAISEVADSSLKAVLLVRQAKKLCEFCREAAELEKRGAFASRMAGHFAALTKSREFADREKELFLLEEELKVLSRFTLTMQDELFGPEKSDGESVLARLKRAANELFADLEQPQALEFRACDEFTLALLDEHRELCDKALKFAEKNKDAVDEGLLFYADELEFYISVHALLLRVKDAGIPLCRPIVSDEGGIRFNNAYDVTLLKKGEKNIIPNDVLLCKDEKFFFLGGANGGGKTTFLRTLGVNLLLAVSGCPAAAELAEIGPIDGVFTHFPRDEHFDGEGRFDNERRRVDEIISRLGKAPLVLLNETYSTTNEEKSLKSTSDLAQLLYSRGAYGIYVTHAHEAKAKGVSRLMVAVDENDSNRRTYKVVRAAEANSSFAIDILKKYALTAEQLKARFPEKEADI